MPGFIGAGSADAPSKAARTKEMAFSVPSPCSAMTVGSAKEMGLCSVMACIVAGSLLYKPVVLKTMICPLCGLIRQIYLSGSGERNSVANIFHAADGSDLTAKHDSALKALHSHHQKKEQESQPSRQDSYFLQSQQGERRASYDIQPIAEKHFKLASMRVFRDSRLKWLGR